MIKTEWAASITKRQQIRIDSRSALLNNNKQHPTGTIEAKMKLSEKKRKEKSFFHKQVFQCFFFSAVSTRHHGKLSEQIWDMSFNTATTNTTDAWNNCSFFTLVSSSWFSSLLLVFMLKQKKTEKNEKNVNHHNEKKSLNPVCGYNLHYLFSLFWLQTMSPCENRNTFHNQVENPKLN